MRTNYVSRTQMLLKDVRGGALEARIKGITHVRDMLPNALSRDYNMHLIASMNYGVHQCIREVKRRNSGK
jgi:hypothetical protein